MSTEKLCRDLLEVLYQFASFFSRQFRKRSKFENLLDILAERPSKAKLIQVFASSRAYSGFGEFLVFECDPTPMSNLAVGVLIASKAEFEFLERARVNLV